MRQKVDLIIDGALSRIHDFKRQMHRRIGWHVLKVDLFVLDVFRRGKPARGDGLTIDVLKGKFHIRKGLCIICSVVNDRINDQGVGFHRVGADDQVGALNSGDVHPCGQFAAQLLTGHFVVGPVGILTGKLIEIKVGMLRNQSNNGDNVQYYQRSSFQSGTGFAGLIAKVQLAHCQLFLEDIGVRFRCVRVLCCANGILFGDHAFHIGKIEIITQLNIFGQVAEETIIICRLFGLFSLVGAFGFFGLALTFGFLPGFLPGLGDGILSAA